MHTTDYGLPRLRGDGPIAKEFHDVGYPAAPPTRGWTRYPFYVATTAPGCPAYAGMDPVSRQLLRSEKRLPRLRGDGPLSTVIRARNGPAAPPTRGWTRDASLVPSVDMGCPAYAGMDPIMLTS